MRNDRDGKAAKAAKHSKKRSSGTDELALSTIDGARRRTKPAIGGLSRRAHLALKHGNENVFPARLLPRDGFAGIKPLLQTQSRLRFAQGQDAPDPAATHLPKCLWRFRRGKELRRVWKAPRTFFSFDPGAGSGSERQRRLCPRPTPAAQTLPVPARRWG